MLDSDQDCNLSLHSVESCQIMLKFLYILIQNSFIMGCGYA
jgi:hypothetical protein